MKNRLSLASAYLDSDRARRTSFQFLSSENVAVATAEYREHFQEQVVYSGKLDQTQRALFDALCLQMVQRSTKKSLEWAYPTSDSACAWGHGETGCWTVKLEPANRPAQTVGAWAPAESEKALAFARSISFEWSPVTLHVHPEYAEAVS